MSSPTQAQIGQCCPLRQSGTSNPDPGNREWLSDLLSTSAVVLRGLFTNTQLAKLTEVTLAVRTPECLGLASHTHQIHGTRRAFSQPISDTGCYYTHFLSRHLPVPTSFSNNSQCRQAVKIPVSVPAILTTKQYSARGKQMGNIFTKNQVKYSSFYGSRSGAPDMRD